MSDLLSGGFVPNFKTIEAGQELTFFRRKMFELEKLIASSKQIFTVQLISSWGEDGHSGDENLIVHIGKLAARLSDGYAAWEEEVHSVFFEQEAFVKTNEVLKGCGYHNFKQLELTQNLVAEVAQVISEHTDWSEDDVLKFEHVMVFDFPEDFDDRFEKAMRHAEQVLMLGEF
ncbi:hypothetical protein [Parasedimentitalea maritima]|uniref:Uncharacterized protein n=1 Tax=Parasedimentitalea maritima TaxID=2578117 RepID=A0A6A4RCS0_9RHOB|nr:hypothetical protein [Zongyanglinia marina]KAE9630505.1 hypothetical protein GP644_08875 [Zongyanglinia marina]